MRHGMASESFDRLREVHLLRIGLPEGGGITPVAWLGLVNAVGLALGIVVAEALRRRTSVVAFGLARGFVAGAVAYWGTLLLRQMVPALARGWANRHIPSEVRATVLSLVSQADAVGQIAGGPLFGWVASAHSTGAAPGRAA